MVREDSCNDAHVCPCRGSVQDDSNDQGCHAMYNNYSSLQLLGLQTAMPSAHAQVCAWHAQHQIDIVKAKF